MMPSMRRMMLLAEQYRTFTLLLENRLEYLREKFLPLITTWLENPENLKEAQTYGDGTPDSVIQHCIDIDPDRTKKSVQWLLTMLLKNRVKYEDLYKATEYLEVFERVKARLPAQARDINRYKSFPDLWTTIEPLSQQVSKAQADRAVAQEMDGQADIVFNDADYKIVIPKTWEAAKHFGINTQWCTAMRNSDTYFNRYTKDGPLYIILDKKNNRRWQFHLPTSQYMDERDHPIDLNGFFFQHPSIRRFFDKIERARWNILGKIGDLLIAQRDYPNIDASLIELKKNFDLPDVKNKLNLEGMVTYDTRSKQIDKFSARAASPETIEKFVDFLNQFGIHGDNPILTDDFNYIYSEPEKKYMLLKDAYKPVLKTGDMTWLGAKTPTRSYYELVRHVEGELKYVYGFEVLGGVITLNDEPPEDAPTAASLYSMLVNTNPEFKISHSQKMPSPFDILIQAGQTDLSEKLMKQRPQWALLKDLYALEGNSQSVRKKIIDLCQEGSETIQMKDFVGDHLAVKKFNDFKEAVEEVGDRDAIRLVDRMDDNDEFDDYTHEVDDIHTASFFEALSREDMIAVGKAIVDADIEESGQDEDSEDEDEYEDIDEAEDSTKYHGHDVSDARAMARMYNSLDDAYKPEWISSAIVTAYNDGMRYGAEKEKNDAILTAIADYPNLMFPEGKLDKNGEFHADPGDMKLGHNAMYGVPCYLVFSIKEIVQAFAHYRDDAESTLGGGWSELLDDKLKIHGPYYGWSDYDEDYAIDRFKDLLDIPDHD